MSARKVNPIVAPRSREDAAALARRAGHWQSGRISGNTGEVTSKGTRFDPADRATLVSLLVSNGWTLRPSDGLPGEEWAHDGTRPTWSFPRACQITLHALAGRSLWGVMRLAPLGIAPLPSAAEQVSP